MAYSLTGHVKSVARLLCRDGSGWTSKPVYGLLANGEHAKSPYVDGIVQYSLIGANARVLADSISRNLTANEHGAIWVKRSGIMMKMYFKAGLRPLPGSVVTGALSKFGRENEWPEIEKLLRAAYAVAKSVEGL